MKSKVRKLFSETFVKTYDYPLIIGFLEANGINDIVPSFEQNENRSLLSYGKFKQWWNQNYKAEKQEVSTVSIEDGDFEFNAEVNPENGIIEYTITQGKKSAVIKLDENANTFMLCNISKAGRILMELSKLNDFGDFLHKFKIYKFLC